MKLEDEDDPGILGKLAMRGRETALAIPILGGGSRAFCLDDGEGDGEAEEEGEGVEMGASASRDIAIACSNARR